MRRFFAKKQNIANEEKGYLESVGDLMSILLFVFIIILTYLIVTTIKPKDSSPSISEILDLQQNLQNKEEELQALQTTLNNTQLQLQMRDSELSRRERELSERLDEIEEMLLKGREVRAHLLELIEEDMLNNYGITVEIDPEAGVLRLPEEILFDSGRAILKPKGITSLEALAEIFATRLPCYSGRPGDAKPEECSCFSPGVLDVILIEGHTDNVPISTYSFSDNWDLSSERSRVTYLYLLGLNNMFSSFTNSDGQYLLGISGYADTRPTQDNNNETEEQRMRNRRIDFRFVLAVPKTVLNNDPGSMSRNDYQPCLDLN
ncbi:MAG: OmpA family protein [Deltaproteobacteria bacterium]|jgi:flagellar motor protein MotB|nr:OmpA family protein [Deltaproteobacteria bacterium]